jgi:hypothetical protein
LLFARAPQPGGGMDAAKLRAAVERVVDGVDPRLRAVSGYQRTLRRPVEHALHYLAECVKVLPPAIAFDHSRSSLDPRLGALFVDPDHLLEILSINLDVRDYLRRGSGPPPAELFVALRMERTERTVLGMSVVDDHLMRDIPQTTVSFHNYRVAFPAAAESETRRQVLERAFDYLIEVTRHRLASKRARIQQLEQQQRQLLQDQPGASGAARPGWNFWWRTASLAGVPQDGAEGHKLREIEREIGGLRTDSATFSEQLALVVGMLREPAAHLRIDRVTLTLDHLNVKVSADSPNHADTLTFSEMVIGPDRRIIMELIRFPSNQLLDPSDLFAAAQRDF